MHSPYFCHDNIVAFAAVFVFLLVAPVGFQVGDGHFPFGRFDEM